MECKLYMYINNWCTLCLENASSLVASAMNLCVQVHGFESSRPHVVVFNYLFNYSMQNMCVYKTVVHMLLHIA